MGGFTGFVTATKCSQDEKDRPEFVPVNALIKNPGQLLLYQDQFPASKQLSVFQNFEIINPGG